MPALLSTGLVLLLPLSGFRIIMLTTSMLASGSAGTAWLTIEKKRRSFEG
ncbi:MAG TPA: hypothetical protein VK210_11620 [Terriglobia bacterium]|nr:hypothetical protein [Terriglobia bacterium]